MLSVSSNRLMFFYHADVIIDISHLTVYAEDRPDGRQIDDVTSRVTSVRVVGRGQARILSASLSSQQPQQQQLISAYQSL